MALTTRVWGAGKLLLLCGALLLTYVLFAAASMRIALRTRDVVVPPLAGRTVNEASALLADNGLSLKVEEARRPDAKVPAGQILAQEPQAGMRIRQRRAVSKHTVDPLGNDKRGAGPFSQTAEALLQICWIIMSEADYFGTA